MRSKNLSLPDLVVLPDVPVPINLPASVESDQCLPAVSDIVSPVFPLPEPSSSVSFSSKLTGAGLLLLHAHRRLWHMHDRALKRMIECGLCCNLVWVPGIVSSTLLGLSYGANAQCSCS
jgi:hypothetical protein